jgi:hypothetical protein
MPQRGEEDGLAEVQMPGRIEDHQEVAKEPTAIQGLQAQRRGMQQILTSTFGKFLPAILGFGRVM